MNPQDFQDKWGPGGPGYYLNERQGAQTYFLDLCDMLGVPQPGTEPGYLFEEKTAVIGQARGYADVFKRGAFAWENKVPNYSHYELVNRIWRDDHNLRRERFDNPVYADAPPPKLPPNNTLDMALNQLLRYSLALSNPPLLVACDRITIRISTQFTGHPSEEFEVTLEDITLPENQALLRRVWLDPESFRPQQTTRDITEKAARSFATLAEQLRKRGHEAEKVAHFLTQCLFCFFAEDVHLLPSRMFERLLNARIIYDNKARLTSSETLTKGLGQLFHAMRDGGMYGSDEVPYFNGGLFHTIDVPKLEITDVTELRNAASLNWRFIDVSIFGTLFERGLDPAKRSQLGAHYTDPATIMRIIDPVVRRPLLQKWELLTLDLHAQLAKSKKKNDAPYRAAYGQYIRFLESLADFKILDPACGSGNFLFLGLKTLKDIELYVINQADDMGLERPLDLCTSPANMLGIEINEFAAELARVTVWIGELQWRIAHGYGFNYNPVLKPLDCIEHRDALMDFNVSMQNTAPQLASSEHHTSYRGGKSTERIGTALDDDPNGLVVYDEIYEKYLIGDQWVSEAKWPKASVVIGNPPFLGGSKKRGELGDAYFEALKTVFKDRVPAGADLVCYWFDKARKQIAEQGLGAAGLVATQSVRSGSNRAVLDAITRDSRIFDAWADEEWVNNGAAVRVSLVSFGWGECCFLNGIKVDQVTAELGSVAEIDMTAAKPQFENFSVAFKGAEKNGSFDISGITARQWLRLPNPNGLPNAEVIKPWRNGQDITNRLSDTWIIDFGLSMPEEDAALFEAPFTRIQSTVKTEREKNNREAYRKNWWRFGEARPGMRTALSDLPRYIATPRVAKHRFFVWFEETVSPDSRLFVITRADDVTFGILSSRIHEVWALANASMHGVGNDPTYNAKSCFETFPFPTGLTPRDTAHQRTEALTDGALIPALPEGTASAAPASADQTIKTDPEKSQKQTAAQSNIAQAAINSVALKQSASNIASAAKRLNDLREAWLNPPEWTQRVPEVVPLGMTASPYPDRTVPRDKLGEADLKALQKRTLTNLYNQRPGWLTMAHQQLDAAVAAAYALHDDTDGFWAHYTPATPDADILAHLLALNHARSA
jgi:hypothetical protein